MTRSSLVATIFVCASVLLGCPPSGGGGGGGNVDAGPIDFVGRSCNVDAECGDLRCDKIRRQCICLSDESCRSTDPAAPIKYCNNYTGLCLEEISGCKSDSECAATEFCDSSIRACRSVKSFCEACTRDGECGGAQDNCVAATDGSKYCSKACATSSDCPRGAACQAATCVPAQNPLTPSEPASCANFKGCTPDSLRTCSANADCADLGDQRCDAARGKCVAIQQVCSFGTVCDPRNKICVSECAADQDCGDATLRCVNKVCEPISECTTDSQCPVNKVCSIPPGASAGSCQPFCQTDSECPLGNICERQTDGRYRCVAGCRTNSSCALDQRCNASNQCEGPNVGATRTCQATAACANCELCNPTKYECYAAKGTFPYCQPCQSSIPDCPGGVCLQMSNGLTYCAKSCVTGQECPNGFVCLGYGGTLADGGVNSACVPSDRSCTNKCL